MSPPVQIYLIAYNRPDLLPVQVAAFHRHLADPHEFVVINNGRGRDKAPISRVARELGIVEHRVRRPNHNNPNHSHARALEYAYREYICKGDYVSLIVDHDVFPYRDFSVHDLLAGTSMAGAMQSRRGDDGQVVHYLHPGLVALDFRVLVEPESISFWPDRVSGVSCDVGGHLWEYWRAHPDLSVHELSLERVDLQPPFSGDGQAPERDPGQLWAESFGGRLLHYRAASNWDHLSPEHHADKTQRLRSLLETDEKSTLPAPSTRPANIIRVGSLVGPRSAGVAGDRLRILHAVEFYEPSRGGAQEVVRQISEAMTAAGHDVTVATTYLSERPLTTINGVRIEEFEIAGNAVRGIRGPSYGYQRYLIEERFDVVMTYAAQQWTTDLALDVVDEIDAPVICAPCGYSALADPAYKNYFEMLPDKLSGMAATVYHSTSYQDFLFAERHTLQNVHVIPNGAAAAEFEDPRPDAVSNLRARHGIRGPLVLSVGSHTGMKGHRQTLAAFVMARTGPATLIINGDGRPGTGCTTSCARYVRALRAALLAQGKQVLLLDLPREELIAAFQAADAFVLLSGVECSPVVLFEAVASGTPFISTDVGNAREIAEWTGAGIVLPRATYPMWSAAHALGRLLADSDQREEMASRGRAAWRARFTWEQIAQSYLDLYRSVVNPTAAAGL